MKLAINAQRPYLVISVESQLPNQFVVTATNEGQTPARINSIWSKMLMDNPNGTLQIPSDKEMANSVMSTPPQLLPPKGTCTVFYCDEHRLELMRGDAFCSVYFHGRISYSNTLGVDPVRPYETKWLYCQLPLKGKLSIPRPDARRPAQVSRARSRERAVCDIRFRRAHECLSAGGSCSRRTGHPFAASGRDGHRRRLS
jgi:hypothetical protein